MAREAIPSGGLAVLVPQVGAASETFVQRHCNELLPGRTCVVSKARPSRRHEAWAPEGPRFEVTPRRAALPRRILRRGFRSVARSGSRPGEGWRVGDQEAARLGAFLDSHGVTVLLGEFLDVWIPLLGIPAIRERRYVAHAHGYDVSRRLDEPGWAAAYARAYRDIPVVAVSEFSRSRLVAAGLSPDLVHVVPCGVRVSPQPPSKPAAEAVRILAVGRLVPKKAPLLLLEAFAAARRNTAVEMTLDLVGEGPLSSACRDFVVRQLPPLAVRLHGSLPHPSVLRLMEEADIFIQHSITDPVSGDQEGLPVAILEAMGRGLPVVSTLHAGIPEAVVDGTTGRLVPERGVRAMAEALVDLAEDPLRRADFGRHGWERASARFSWEVEQRRLAELLWP